MNTLSAKRLTVSAVLVSTFLLPQTARADVPAGQLTASRDEFQVRLDLSWYYHGSYMPTCKVTIERAPHPAHEATVVFSGDLGEISYDCVCGKWFTWEPGMEEAEGRSCSPGDGMYDVGGDCPEGHSCDCTRICEPFYDAPCDGSHYYKALALNFSHPSGSGDEARASIEVDWMGPFCADPPPVLGSGSDGGCSTAGARPHLIMCLILALAAVVPFWVRRRNRNS